MKAFTMIHFRRQHVGKWFGQASEIEELRAENSRLKEQVATLEARLRAAYADAGVTALAGSSFPSPEAAAPTPVPDTSSPASLPELNAVEIQMIAEGRVIYAVKNYKDRTGVDLKTAKAAIDAARRGSANR
ncbi:50S ribosomal protein L7/L12 [Pauljensenia sp. 27098_8_107]